MFTGTRACAIVSISHSYTLFIPAVDIVRELYMSRFITSSPSLKRLAGSGGYGHAGNGGGLAPDPDPQNRAVCARVVQGVV